MQKIKNIFLKKKILIYGLGKSGLSTLNFLKSKSELYLYDDNKNNTKNPKHKKKIIEYNNLIRTKFDHIIISPGIDINTCRLSNFIKKNLDKLNTDIDIFYSIYNKNKNITITGSNGKSTTAKILYEVLKDQKFDVRLVGNIGKPILSEKKINKKTLFVIEASSYQLEYSKIFKSNFAAILNISPDHLERHKTLQNYIRAKFKLIKNQQYSDTAFLNIKDKYLKKEIKRNQIKSKIINVESKIESKILQEINNPYFLTDSNIENLSFIIKISKKLKLNQNKLIKTLKKFKGLDYRQQIIYKSKFLTIINDSKATSYSSSVSLLKSLTNVYWIVGGIPKLGDRFLLPKKLCNKTRAYIFGKNKKEFIKQLKNKMFFKTFSNLNIAIKKIFDDIKSTKMKKHNVILFSPSSASFDKFKNFEERGRYFNNQIKKQINAKY
jgi:UDP-N-acetylmuramoylalanine--D-glutamate ligase